MPAKNARVVRRVLLSRNPLASMGRSYNDKWWPRSAVVVGMGCLPAELWCHISPLAPYEGERARERG